ncbi:hypothetical protein [Rathayibacter toxicus]|uniref:Uncharacterized protein n=1 Tax=Rathayibacter toxicus TaxID=145458 RepID=A0A2S5Y516_9MICO|nr:hypothetical protein [Rathayibacter toxicus]ALS57699.1 hypothetical protein APU90_07890 [Rathayibacter toxicus]PPG20630.1 hypothetical protein C5D15_09030 [Rathayibacter toxicus]PPG45734.1 hypothetical protein C5D16_09000 [Rathayibacter toxicus]PPH21681.1 hypothetical protein C5D17_09020 [Rathayibacter toxicus]PPH56110.1 hypothetical protein C5D30_09010 [Rathayibacter toxicus]
MAGFVHGAHVFIDETKARGYVVAASAVASAHVKRTEQAVRALVRQGQRRFHFNHESDSSRRGLL